MRLLVGRTEHRERLVSPHEGGVLKIWRGEESERKGGWRWERNKERKEGEKGGRERRKRNRERKEEEK